MKILCVLYDDPKTGMPDKYARDDLPTIEKYPDGMTFAFTKGNRLHSW
jgi:formate dehydrogenase